MDTASTRRESQGSKEIKEFFFFLLLEKKKIGVMMNGDKHSRTTAKHKADKRAKGYLRLGNKSIRERYGSEPKTAETGEYPAYKTILPKRKRRISI